MDFSKVCRTCLSTKSLNPIFKNQNCFTRYTTAVYISAGIEVVQNDGLPQNMCSTCITFLNNSLRFRKQCKNAENQLLNVKNTSIENCDLVDRCKYCKINYDTKELLIEHVKTCTAKKKRRSTHETCKEMTECDICKKTMQKASLKMHKAIKHAGLGPVCEHCGRRFGNKFRLNEHYRAKHGYEKFKCSYCEFQSAAVIAMRNHERRHRGEKPFVCETCDAKFHAAYLLAQHKHSHRAEKIHKCDQCPASFKANNSLHMHKATCHSAALYKCAMCARAYACRHYVVKHMRHVHKYSGTVPELQVLPNSIQQNIDEGHKLEVEPTNAQISSEKNEPLLDIW
ncbi:hypothetical protein K1T71_014361 [Dendrolimus kikuchii]|uniref:Uncharacterized protein n=1 Tax=Dendrolimus kikuchii TaxID=765133 RepID=A0ACC1CDR8_9NEOP|nr:hypothetical protein K1T71_014361 [Dendrolimus kikuchii]